MAGRTAKRASERDIDALRFIGKAGVASLGQLRAGYWPSAQERTARTRLDQMKRAGWIEKHIIDTRTPGEVVYTLTRKGAREFFTRPEQERFMIGLPQRAELKQQLMAQDARLALEKQYATRGFKLFDWQNVRELYSQALRGQGAQRKRGKVQVDIPDAAAVFVNAQTGERAELDIEIDGAYYGKMLTHKIGQFARSGKPTIWATRAGPRASRIAGLTSAASNISVLAL